MYDRLYPIREHLRLWLVLTAIASLIAVTVTAPAPADAQSAPDRTIVATSGVPHGDVGDLTESPYWSSGAPTGQNGSWRAYMTTVVAQITDGADTVLHSGDQVEGRWYSTGGKKVLGPRDTWEQRKAYIRRAADIYYGWIGAYWAGHDVLWGMGDHEIGDLPSSGVVQPDTFRYNAWGVWRDAWKDQYGYIKHYNRRGNVGIVTLDPFVKWNRGVLARIRSDDFDYLADRVQRLRDRGADWIVVQCEVPAVGPNRKTSSSGVLLENGDKLWSELDRLDVDLLVSGEFHADTTHSTDGAAPVQVVTGGRHLRAAWLRIEVFGADRLELSVHESVGTARDDREIWASAGALLPRYVDAGTPQQIGRATLHADGQLTDRHGVLREGIDGEAS